MSRQTYYSGLPVKIYLRVLLEQIADRLRAVLPTSSLTYHCSKVFESKWFHTDNFTHVFEYTVVIDKNRMYFYTDTDGYLIMIESCGANSHWEVDQFIIDTYHVWGLEDDVLSLNEPDVQDCIWAQNILNQTSF